MFLVGDKQKTFRTFIVCRCSDVCQGMCNEPIVRVEVTLFSKIGGPTMVGSSATENFLIVDIWNGYRYSAQVLI